MMKRITASIDKVLHDFIKKERILDNKRFNISNFLTYSLVDWLLLKKRIKLISDTDEKIIVAIPNKKKDYILVVDKHAQ